MPRTVVVEMTYKKETPGTRVFEADDRDNAEVTNVYARKMFGNLCRAKRIRVTCEVVEE